MRPHVETNTLIDEFQRVSLPIVGVGFHDPTFTISSKKFLMRSSVIAPMPYLSASPESTMPYSLV